MENVVGTELGEDALHALFLADAGDNGVHPDIWPALSHHQSDVVLRSFGLVDEHHLGGSKLSNLAYHLAADATCRTGDKDALTREHATDALEVDLDLIAWQEVVDAHLLEFDLFFVGTFGISLGHIDLHASLGEHALQLLVVAELVVALRRHQDGTDAEAFQNIIEVLYLIDGHAHELMSL